LQLLIYNCRCFTLVGDTLCLILLAYSDSKKSKDYDSALRKWQKDFNENCLQKKGIFCKTKTFTSGTGIYHIGNGDETANERILVIKWVAFVLSSSQIDALENEPHLETGKVERPPCGVSCCCCCPNNNKTLCISQVL